MGIFDDPMLIKQSREVRRRRQKDEENIVNSFCSPQNINLIVEKISDELARDFVGSGGVKPTHYYLEIGSEYGATFSNRTVIVSSDQCREALRVALRDVEPSVKSVSLSPTYESSTTHVSIEVRF